MKNEFLGSCTSYLRTSTLIIILCFVPTRLYQQQLHEGILPDSGQTKWSQPFGTIKLSPAQLIQLRAIQNPFNLHMEMTYGMYPSSSYELTDFSRMYHSWDNSYLSYPGIEYRHGSNYIPQNVRDYTEFKMGRDRYMPIFNPVLIGFILYNVTQYASYYFGDKDSQSLYEKLNRPQKQMLLVLQQNYPVNQEIWYSLYQNSYPDSSLSKSLFFNHIKVLDELSLVKTRTFEENEIRYYPVIGVEAFPPEETEQK